MLKKFLILVFSALYLVLCTTTAKADNEFSIDSVVTYNVQDSGKTIVTHDTTLENNFSTLYATTYTLSLENIDAQNIKASDSKGSLATDVKKDGDQTSITVTFPEAVVGQGSKRQFSISYENSSFAVRTGEVWEVSIPRLGEGSTFRNYTVNLLIPQGFGQEAYISPKPRSSNPTASGISYTFNKADISQTGITAGFGQFQVFSFNLAYHLENPLSISSETQIALPPDTAFQKVYFDKIDPKPSNVTVDPDGNWLASYKLTPRQRVDVNVSGSVQIFASFRPFPKPKDDVLAANLRSTQYWQVDDPSIKALAAILKTPRQIYDYVVKNLKYDFARVQPNVQRMGAIAALQNPTQAICMEFTDTFIAIARAAGIPAREINGYAYTENPDLQPLSLVADVLHSWPEYYDKDKGAWIPIDPTWGSTTGGVDFFDKLDLRHFTFVIHGEDSTKPYPPGSYKLGSNPQKDVFVSFGKLPSDRVSQPVIWLTGVSTIPFLNTTLNIKFLNPGPSALYSLYPTVYFDDVQNSRNFVDVLPPLASYNFQVKVPFSLLGKNTPEKVRIVVAGSSLEIPTNKTQVIINSLLALFGVFFVILIALLIRLKKITFRGVRAKIASIYERFRRRPPANTDTA